MNVLFLTMTSFLDISHRGIYTDLMRHFRERGHHIYIISPLERRLGRPTTLTGDHRTHILHVRTLNLQKSNVIEKGVGQLLVGWQYKRALKKYFGKISFDLILYVTPPITLYGVVAYVKQRNSHSIAYLMLKDIFPQNAVDLNMLSTKGVKGLIYHYFRRKEVSFYRVSDYIGCMSPANVNYLLKHNAWLDTSKVEVAPNSMEPNADKQHLNTFNRTVIRRKFGLPTSKPLFIYGGNIGKPQGISFMLQCLDANKDRKDCHFVIAGGGMEFPRVEEWMCKRHPKAVTLFHQLPQDEYEQLVSVCDVGLIFLDHRFTIPNYPSRLLTYLMEGKPIIAATDTASDVGTIAEENGYGLWCISNNVEAFTNKVDEMLRLDIKTMGLRGYQFFLNNYTTAHTYNIIMQHFK